MRSTPSPERTLVSCSHRPGQYQGPASALGAESIR